MRDALQSGAAALLDLIRRVGAKGDADLEAAEQAAGPDGDDTRDYRAMSAMVVRDLEANLHHQSPAHREGYLRALTGLLSIVADGCSPGKGWNPIVDTEGAFMASRAAGELLARVVAEPGQAAG